MSLVSQVRKTLGNPIHPECYQLFESQYCQARLLKALESPEPIHQYINLHILHLRKPESQSFSARSSLLKNLSCSVVKSA